MLRSNKRDYKEAFERAKRTARLVRKVEAARKKEDWKLAQKLEDEICRLVRMGFWEHFKSSDKKPMYYFVEEVRPHVNYRGAHAFQVLYRAQYAPQMNRKTGRELLGKDGFLTPIRRKGYTGPRFRWVGPALPLVGPSRNPRTKT